MRSDEALYEAWVQGNLRAFDQLYARYERSLFGFVRRHFPAINEAEDVLHETFMAVLRDRNGAAAHTFRAWIFQVARNLCLNRKRSLRRAEAALQKESSEPVESASHPEELMTRNQSHRMLGEAVKRLPMELAELYQLRVGGLSYEEMASVLHLPLGTVKSRMHQMVHLLQTEVSR